MFVSRVSMRMWKWNIVIANNHLRPSECRNAVALSHCEYQGEETDMSLVISEKSRLQLKCVCKHRSYLKDFFMTYFSPARPEIGGVLHREYEKSLDNHRKKVIQAFWIKYLSL